MGCNCNEKKYSISMGCCQPVLGPIENYYTKYAIDKMLEEIESGITSGCCITPEEVDEKIDEAISGISPDLSDYYTKEEVDELIPEVPSLSGYATEQWVEDKHYITGVDLSDYATKEEIPTVPTSNTAFTNDAGYLTEHQSLSGYATEQWVEDKHYITGVDLSDYALKSEIPTVPTSNTAFTNDAGYITDYDIPDLAPYATMQWVLNQYYAKNSELIQYITNLQNQIDSLKEQISGCCGSTGETITRWITMTGENDYTCSGTTKMTKEKEQQSTDGGNTWTDTGNYRSGSTVLEENSVDCGYIEPQYRWKAAPQSDYMCSGTSKYYKVYYEVSYDGGTTWQHVQPEQTKRGSLIEADSTDCGYSPDFKLYAKLYGGGEKKIACNSSSALTKEETDLATGGYKTVTIGNCVTSISEKAFQLESYLTDVIIPSNVKTIGRMAFAGDRRISALTLSEGTTTIGDGAFKSCTSLSSVTIPNSVTQLVGDTFYTNNIKTLVIGSGVTSIGAMCFQRTTSVTGSTITCLATTPPTIVNNSPIFSGWDNAPIYVPSASVNAYKTASGWSQYASRIQAIP